MEKIAILAHDEPVGLDPDQLGSLYAQLGENTANGIISCALEELANRLSLVERNFYANDFPGLKKAARGMIGIADQMGMPMLAAAAKNVAECADGLDQSALAATIGRLVRLGDRSLSAIWEIQDHDP